MSKKDNVRHVRRGKGFDKRINKGLSGISHTLSEVKRVSADMCVLRVSLIGPSIEKPGTDAQENCDFMLPNESAKRLLETLVIAFGGEVTVEERQKIKLATSEHMEQLGIKG